MDVAIWVVIAVAAVVIVVVALVSSKRAKDRGQALLAQHPDAARLYVIEGESISKGAALMGASETITVERVNGAPAGRIPKSADGRAYIVVPAGEAVLRIGYQYKSGKGRPESYAPDDFHFTFAPATSYQLVFDHEARMFRLVPYVPK